MAPAAANFAKYLEVIFSIDYNKRRNSRTTSCIWLNPGGFSTAIGANHGAELLGEEFI